MATTSLTNPATAFSEAARFGEIRNRILFLIGALVVYRIGTFIPVPGVNPAEVARFFADRSNTILGIVNLFSGGALSRLSIFAMGVMPYISASIIIQMMSMVVPTLMELRKEGESGRRKITQYTRIGTVGVALALLIVVLATTAFVVFVERAQRRIPVDYAKRQVGRRMYAGQSSHLPFKMNMSGVIPPIFASSLLLFPATLASFFGTSAEGPISGFMQNVAAALGYGQPLHLLIYALLIIFFCFFYTALVFNARDTADNLKKSGAFVRGIRPGQQTAEYIDQVLTRLTLWGALYVMLVCLLPEILVSWQGVPFHFGGTSLLIVVVVVMDFMSQLHAHTMSHHYPNLLKKANLLGYGRTGSGGQS